MAKKTVSLNRKMADDYNYNEAIKTLRTNLQFCGNNIKAILFTSAMPDEGKSDLSFAAAQSLASIGKKTILIDCDIRKSILVTRYNLEEEVNGLTHYLTGQKPLDDVLYATDAPNLDVIFAGPYSPKPTELLEESLFSDLMQFARANYDFIIVDTPPMGNLIDGAIVARQCDGAVMVIESGAISYHLEQKVMEQLTLTGCPILGVILNKVDIYDESYYGRYGKYAKYGKYTKYGKYSKYGKYGKYGKYEKYGRYDPYEPYDRKADEEEVETTS